METSMILNDILKNHIPIKCPGVDVLLLDRAHIKKDVISEESSIIFF